MVSISWKENWVLLEGGEVHSMVRKPRTQNGTRPLHRAVPVPLLLCAEEFSEGRQGQTHLFG